MEWSDITEPISSHKLQPRRTINLKAINFLLSPKLQQQIRTCRERVTWIFKNQLK